MVTLGAISGQMILRHQHIVAGAVEAGGLDHFLADALHAGEKHQRRKAEPVPDIGEQDAAERRVFVAKPGMAPEAHQRQHLVDQAEQRMQEQFPKEADDDRRQHHRQEDDDLVDAVPGQRLQQRVSEQESGAVLEHHQRHEGDDVVLQARCRSSRCRAASNSTSRKFSKPMKPVGRRPLNS